MEESAYNDTYQANEERGSRSELGEKLFKPVTAQWVDPTTVEGRCIVLENLLVAVGPGRQHQSDDGCGIHSLDAHLGESAIVHRWSLVRVVDHESFYAGEDTETAQGDREEDGKKRSVHEGTEDDVHQEGVLVMDEEERTQVDLLKIR